MLVWIAIIYINKNRIEITQGYESYNDLIYEIKRQVKGHEYRILDDYTIVDYTDKSTFMIKATNYFRSDDLI